MKLKTPKKEVVVRLTKSEIEELDVTGETCPGPIMLVGDRLSSMAVGERLKVSSKSSESVEDIAVSIAGMGGKILDQGLENGKSYAVIERVEKEEASNAAVERNKVLVVQSNGTGNAEKAYATFIFSKAALSMGKEVTVFLLMDGVSIAKRGNAKTVKHPAFDRLDKLMEDVIKKEFMYMFAS